MTTEMSFEEFRARCIELNGGGKVLIDEHGKNGWTHLEVDDKGPHLIPGQEGPHWCDVAPCPRDGTLIGRYDFKTRQAEFFMEQKNLLTQEERDQLIEECRVQCLDRMFGDGQEDDYVMDGFPEFKGLNNMTDDELLKEYGHYTESDDTPEKRAAAFRRELEEE